LVVSAKTYYRNIVGDFRKHLKRCLLPQNINKKEISFFFHKSFYFLILEKLPLRKNPIICPMENCSSRCDFPDTFFSGSRSLFSGEFQLSYQFLRTFSTVFFCETVIKTKIWIKVIQFSLNSILRR